MTEVKVPSDPRSSKLFVYGIFLGTSTKEHYGMTNPVYAVVRDWLTTEKGGSIVEAVPAPKGYGIALTGQVVDVEPSNWASIDRLETGYRRIRVTTSNGTAWMYAAPESKS